jgi:non-specific serine/threonine protein kinase
VNTEIANPNPLPAGSKLADYVVTGILGEGGFGIVYSARDEQLGRTIAIKEYLPSSIAGRTSDLSVRVRSTDSVTTFHRGLQSFMGEAKLLAQCSHPALLEVYRVWEQNETAYIAMRLCHGQTAREARRTMEHGMPEAEIRQLLMPVFDAVMHLHAKEVIHRDISPDNIMISPSGAPTLLDLGAARTVLAGESHALTTLLKPGYAPIEQYDDDGSMQQGPWTDVYGLGALIYFLVMGNTPKQSIYRAIRDSLEPIPVSTESGYSQQFADAITRALTVHPGQRTQNVMALIADLGWTWQTTQTVLPLTTQTRPPITEIKAPAQTPIAVPLTVAVVAPTTITAQTTPNAIDAPKIPLVVTEQPTAHTAARQNDPEATVFWQPHAVTRPPEPVPAPPVVAPALVPAAVALSAPIIAEASVTSLERAGIKVSARKSTLPKAHKISLKAGKRFSPWVTRGAAAAGVVIAGVAVGVWFSGTHQSVASVANRSSSTALASNANVEIAKLEATAMPVGALTPPVTTAPELTASVTVTPAAIATPESIAKAEKLRTLEALVTRDPNADRNEEQQRFDRVQRERAAAEAKTKATDAAQTASKDKTVTVNSLAALAQNAQRQGKTQEARAYWTQLATLQSASPRSRAQALSSAATRLCAAGNIDSCEQLFVQAFRADASWRLANAEAEQPQLSQAYRAARAKAWGY